jgi:SagB-type dehydrogenase family enzyme
MVRVRRSPHLVSYWRDNGIITRNYATGHAVVGDPLVSYVLTLCADWTSVTELCKRLPGVPRRTLAKLVGSMLAQRLLLRHGDVEDPRDTALETWRAWNPAAGFFHFSTKNMPAVMNREVAERRLSEERQTQGAPPQIKRYPTDAVVNLPSARVDGDFPEVLLRRRTWRSFSSEGISLQDISTLLGLTWGVQRTAESVFLGPVHLKTSPSSGARQPLEAYMLAVRVEGLRPGLYHYAPDRHCLELVKRGGSARTIAKYIPGQWWYDSAAAIFMMTAVFARTQWRYRFPRAYRSVLLEAGHVCQTFCLVATWLGLAPFCTGRFSDADVERDIRVDGVTESFIYGAGVGQRPPGVEWAPWALDSSPESPLNRRSRRPRAGRPEE